MPGKNIVGRKALFELRNALLNKREGDIRKNMMEAVAGYPCAVEQKKIVHKQVLALTETEAIQREKNHSPEDPIIHF